jgi:hypothetical protein
MQQAVPLTFFEWQNNSLKNNNHSFRGYNIAINRMVASSYHVALNPFFHIRYMEHIRFQIHLKKYFYVPPFKDTNKVQTN